MSFAEQIRSSRIDLGLTQEELGKAVGVSGQAVSKWESIADLLDTEGLVHLHQHECTGYSQGNHPGRDLRFRGRRSLCRGMCRRHPVPRIDLAGGA